MQELLTSVYMGIALPDWASMLSLCVAIVGFTVTLVKVAKSTSASESAKLAAEQATHKINLLETVHDLSTLLSILEAIKTDVRRKNFEPLPEKLSNIRKSLIGIRAKYTNLSESDQSTIQSAITQFRSLERKIDMEIEQNSEIKIGATNHLFSVHIDELYEVLSTIRSGDQ